MKGAVLLLLPLANAISLKPPVTAQQSFQSAVSHDSFNSGPPSNQDVIQYAEEEGIGGGEIIENQQEGSEISWQGAVIIHFQTF